MFMHESMVRCTIRGFKEQNLIDLNALTELIRSLPAAHLEQLQEIMYLPKGRYIYPALNSPPSVKGEYDQETLSVYIFSCRSREELIHVLFHEIGHHVYYKYLTFSQRQLWGKAFLGERAPITRYAGKNAVEDFAESYAIFVQGNKAFCAQPVRKHLLTDIFDVDRSTRF